MNPCSIPFDRDHEHLIEQDGVLIGNSFADLANSSAVLKRRILDVAASFNSKKLKHLASRTTKTSSDTTVSAEGMNPFPVDSPDALNFNMRLTNLFINFQRCLSGRMSPHFKERLNMRLTFHDLGKDGCDFMPVNFADFIHTSLMLNSDKCAFAYQIEQHSAHIAAFDFSQVYSWNLLIL